MPQVLGESDQSLSGRAEPDVADSSCEEDDHSRTSGDADEPGGMGPLGIFLVALSWGGLAAGFHDSILRRELGETELLFIGVVLARRWRLVRADEDPAGEAALIWQRRHAARQARKGQLFGFVEYPVVSLAYFDDLQTFASLEEVLRSFEGRMQDEAWLIFPEPTPSAPLPIECVIDGLTTGARAVVQAPRRCKLVTGFVVGAHGRPCHLVALGRHHQQAETLQSARSHHAEQMAIVQV